MRTSIDVTIEVEIDRPPSTVWSFLFDIDRIPEWIGEFTAARTESDGPFGLGSVVRYTLEQGDRSGTWEVVEWDPPRRSAWDGPPLLGWARGGMRPRGSHELAEIGQGRTLLVSHYRPELTGPLVLLRPYLQRWVRRERSASALALKALVEAEPAS